MEYVVGSVDANRLPSFNYTPLNYLVVAVRGDILYGTDTNSTKLYKSTDNGVTWSASLWTIPAGKIAIGYLMSSGALIIFSTDGKVYRSTDDANFATVLTGISSPLNSKGVDSNGNLICFGEYSVVNGTPIRLYYSNDGGVTWNIGSNLGNSDSNGLTHIHTCQYLMNLSLWIATTGDTTLNWYKSTDGITWTLMLTSTNQKQRILGIVCNKKGELMFCSDGGAGYGGIFRSNILGNTIDIDDISRLLTLPSSYGMAGTSDVLVATSMATAAYGKKSAFVYVSLDQGNTWYLDKTFLADPAQANGGIRDIMGPDNKGNFYLCLNNCSGYTTNATIKATYNAEKVKMPIREAAMRINGTRKTVVTKSFSVANAASGSNNYLNYVTPPGYIDTIIGVTCVIPAVSGSTNGTHKLEFTWGAAGYGGRIFTVSANYNVSLDLYQYAVGTGVTFSDGNIDYLRRMLDGKTIQLVYNTPIWINYKNLTDVARADTINVNLMILREAIISE